MAKLSEKEKDFLKERKTMQAIMYFKGCPFLANNWQNFLLINGLATIDTAHCFLITQKGLQS